MHPLIGDVITNNRQMESQYATLATLMLSAKPFDRGEVHAQKTTTPEMVTREILHVQQRFEIDAEQTAWGETIKPNLPWAEDHFQERVGGEPLNPPPAEAWWPFAQKGNEAHKKADKFSHTYPERFWPKYAGEYQGEDNEALNSGHRGIRFQYGDLWDLVNVLRKNPRSRQAYLPIWFPEDLYAANAGERVPCTLGYHFLMNWAGEIDCTYNMRSCDMVRFYRDDIYMAGRLVQWVCHQLGGLKPGQLILNIANLHTFVGDQQFLEKAAQYDPRQNYDFGAL